MKFALHVALGISLYLSIYKGVAPIFIFDSGSSVLRICSESTNQFARNNPREQTRFESLLRPNRKNTPASLRRKSCHALDRKFRQFAPTNPQGQIGLKSCHAGFSSLPETFLIRRLVPIWWRFQALFYPQFRFSNTGRPPRPGPREAVTRRRLFGGGPCRIDCGDVATRGT